MHFLYGTLSHDRMLGPAGFVLRKARITRPGGGKPAGLGRFRSIILNLPVSSEISHLPADEMLDSGVNMTSVEAKGCFMSSVVRNSIFKYPGRWTMEYLIRMYPN